MKSSPDLRILPDRAALFQAAADEFVRQANAAIASKGRFTVALAGGSTPKGLYSLLAAKAALPWDKMYFFFGDERHVPPDHPDSNFRMASESLLSKAPIPEKNVHRIHAELDAEAAAAEYEQQLVNFFHLSNLEMPRFDLIFLGIGPDGHTASLFPGSNALTESSRRVMANWVEKFKTFRITFTFPVLNHAAEVVFLVSGADKAQILSEVLRPGIQNYPAQGVQPENGRLLWLVDQDAGSLLRFVTPPVR